MKNSFIWSDLTHDEKLVHGYRSSDSESCMINIPKADGEYVYKYNDKKVRRLVNYKDGKKHGKQYYYFFSGNISIEENYKNGKRHSKQYRYFPNGRKAQVKTYVNGKNRGIEMSYCEENGHIKTIETIKVSSFNNKYIRKKNFYRPDKTIERITYFYGKTKKMVNITFDSDNKIETYTTLLSRNGILYGNTTNFNHFENKIYIVSIVKNKRIEKKIEGVFFEKYGGEFSYYTDGTLESYNNHDKKGFGISCYSGRRIKSIMYYGKNSYEYIQYNPDGIKTNHDFYKINQIGYVENKYEINTKIKIAIRIVQNKFRKKYTEKIYRIFYESTNIIRPLFDLIIEYMFKLNNFNVFDHSIIHCGCISNL